MEQVSFRDPGGFVFRCGDRVLRYVHPRAAEDLRAFLASTIAATWMANGTVSETIVLSEDARAELPLEIEAKISECATVLEHKPIRFPSYPYEWAPEMLHAAAALTVSVARIAGGAGFGLKDATPYNVMFEGSKPVFIDLLSFERRNSLDPLWRPHAQFVRTFIYPLLANRYFRIRLDEVLLAHRDGLEPERVLALCPLWRRWLPPFLGSVTLPAILSLGGDDPVPDRFRERSAGSSQEATFLLDRLFRRTSRLLAGALDPAPRKETDYYTESGQAYTAKKERVVEEALERWQFRSVLDIGGNIGRFSVLAARHGASVVAIDRDPDAAGMLWRTANRDGLDILALVIDIARPPGACGWANAEFPSFLDRARGKFDCVLMLALIHHLLINERVPPEKIFELVAELTTNVAIVEYIDRTDLQFQRIARGRAALHGDFTRDSFEAAARSHFKILESWEVSPTRRIYTLQKSPD